MLKSKNSLLILRTQHLCFVTPSGLERLPNFRQQTTKLAIEHYCSGSFENNFQKITKKKTEFWINWAPWAAWYVMDKGLFWDAVMGADIYESSSSRKLPKIWKTGRHVSFADVENSEGHINKEKTHYWIG